MDTFLEQNPNKRHSQPFQQWKIVTGVGTLIAILSVILGFIIVPKIIDIKIIEEMRLVNGSETWGKWLNIPVPIYLKFYIMHVTNPDDVEQKWAKPKLEEKGPYAYRQKRVKTKIEQAPGEEEILRFEETITYHFDEDMSGSKLSEDDLVNVINVALISVISGLAEVTGSGYAAYMANGDLQSEKLIQRNVKVGELTFKGFDAKVYTNSLGSLLPSEFKDDRFGLYKGKNGTTDGEYEIHTGVESPVDFGRIKTWNGKTTLDNWWKPGSPCAKINGTIFVPPFVEKSRILELFVSDLCRSIYLTYEKEIEYLGIKGYRFVIPPKMLENPRSNLDNQCFCTTENLNDCPKSGLISIASCRGGAPIAISSPHFLYGDEEYLSASGMTPPIKEDHETFFDLEPKTGLILQARKRIQVNVELRKIRGVKAMKHMKTNYMVFPLLWACEEGGLDDVNADDLKRKLVTPLKIINISKWLSISIGLIFIGVGLTIYVLNHHTVFYAKVKGRRNQKWTAVDIGDVIQ